MSRENVEIVRRIIDAINRRDIDAVVESASADLVMDWSNSRGLLSGIHRGRDKARDAFYQSKAEALEAAGKDEQ
jgi:ketosteroid isomerase-like protein